MFKNQKLTTIFKSLIVVAIFFSCYSVTLAAWTAPTDTPPACNPATPGCNPPVNVSSVKQIKPGILSLGISELLPNFLSALEVDETRIRGYFAEFSNRIISESDFLNIFGHGTSPDRDVKIWDNLTVPGDIRAYNYYICTEAGSCSELVNNDGSLWEQNGSSIYYNSGNVGIGTSNPESRLEIGGTLKLKPQATASDPAGSNGMIYYNETMKKFRCYEDGFWFNCFSVMTPTPPTVSAVSVAGVASGWPSGEAKQVSFTYANFSGTTNTVTVSVCHPVNFETCLVFSPSPESLTLSGSGNSAVSKTHGSLVYQRLVDGDSLITPYFDASRRTKIKVCPTNTAGVVPAGGVCAFSAPYTIVAPLTPTTYTLTITKAGTGDGSFAVTPTGIYAPGTRVMAMASASTGSVFAGWSGDCSGTGGTIDILMDRNKSCVATFNLETVIPPSCTYGPWVRGTCGPCQGTSPSCTKSCPETRTTTPAGCTPVSGERTSQTVSVPCTCPAPISTYTLTIGKSGDGSGSVTPSVGSHSYDSGAEVDLTATAHSGSVFAGWSGSSGCSSGSVTMFSNKTCTARFNVVQYTLTITKSGDGATFWTDLMSPATPLTIDEDFKPGKNFTLNSGEGLVLVARPDIYDGGSGDYSLFRGYTGAVTGTSLRSPTFIMDGDKTINMNFRDFGYIFLDDPAGVPDGYNCSLSISGCESFGGSMYETARSCKITRNVSGYTSSTWGQDCATVTGNDCYLRPGHDIKTAKLRCSY